MGIKLEWVVLVLIIATISMTTTSKLDNSEKNNINFTKELEFTDTTFIEVDNKKMQAHSFSTYGKRNNGVLYLDNIMYHTDNIKLLSAKKARYEQDILYLAGDVVLEQKEGFLYQSEHANYNQKTEILTLTSPFRAKMQHNIILGQTLKYNAKTKELRATNIDATIYTIKK